MRNRFRSQPKRRKHRLVLETLEDRLAPAGVSGMLWHDADGDGQQGAQEIGLPGWTVYLDLDRNGQLNGGEPTTTTDSAGNYSFTGLPAGDYAVAQLPPAGWAQTTPLAARTAGALTSADWKAQGPFGGDVAAVAVSPVNPNLMFAGIAPTDGSSGNGALYRSVDGGNTWSEVYAFHGRPDSQENKAVYDIELTPTGIVYVGTSFGLFRSGDGGATWVKQDLDVGLQEMVYEIAVRPDDANHVWVGLSETSGSQANLLLRTADGGATWQKVSPPLGAFLSGEGIAFDPSNPSHVFVGFGGNFGGRQLWFSPDNGSTWVNRTVGLPDAPIKDVVHDGTRVLVTGGTAFNSQGFGLYQSTNDGATWTRLDSAWPNQLGTDIEVDAANPANILVATEGAGVFHSTDGGASWSFSVAGTEAMTVKSARFVPGSSTQVVIGATSFAVLKSDNGGAQFQSSTQGILALNVASTAVNPNNPDEIAVAFSSLRSGGVYTTSDGGKTWSLAPLPATAYSTVDFAPDGRLYAISNSPVTVAQEGLYRRNADGSWTPLGPDLGVHWELDLRVIRFSRNNPDLILVGGLENGSGSNGVIYRSADSGATWTRVYESSDALDEIRDIDILEDGTDQVMLASFVDFNASNSSAGGVLRSIDGGLTWVNSSAGLTSGTQGYSLALSGDPGKIYLADGDQRGLFSSNFGGLFVSNDGGLTWTNTGRRGAIQDVLLDPEDEQIIYIASTSAKKIERSENGGATFQLFDQGLDSVPYLSSAGYRLTYVATGVPRLLLTTRDGLYASRLFSAETPAREVSLAAGENRTGLDFGSAALPGEIQGTLWEDSDGDGQRDVSESGVRWWTVFLDADGDGVLDSGEQATATQDFGVYRFSGVAPGLQRVAILLQPGWEETYPQSPAAHVFTLAPGQVATTKDFGIHSLPTEIRGVKWNDLDGDGARDAGEPGLAGWTIYLDLNADGQRQANEPTTLTDAQGNYAFQNLTPGAYLVAELPQARWQQTAPDIGNSEEPTLHHAWADHDPSTPNLIDIWYDFRPQAGYANLITADQQAVVAVALTRWADATYGKIRFSRNTSATAEDIINIGTGNLAAVGYTSGLWGVLGAGGGNFGENNAIIFGVAWMDSAEMWDVVIGNNDPSGGIDYFTVAAHEIGHALGLDHIEDLPWANIMNEEYTGERTALTAIDADRFRAIYGAGGGNALGFYVATLARGDISTGNDFGAVSLNQAPVAGNDAYATNEDTPLNVAAPGLLGNDSDGNGDPLTVVLVSGPSHGTLSLNSDGSFTYTPVPNYNGSDSFSYRASDGLANSNLATVTLTIHAINDVPVANAGPDKTANEGAVISFSGSGSDADGDALTYTWNFGDGGTASGATASHTYADNGSYTVTLTVSDGKGGSSSDTLLVTVNNVAPLASVTGPASGVRGQARTFTLGASDPSPVDQAAGFTFAINWGDGTTQTVTGAVGQQVNHIFAASGSFTVKVTATDKDGAASGIAQHIISINAAAMQGSVLAVSGTAGVDTIVLAPANESGAIRVTINNAQQGDFTGVNQILVYGQAGNDAIQLNSTKFRGQTYYITTTAVLFGDDGNDTLDARGSSANNVLVGGAGTDSLQGGLGRDILMGGLGADTLRGNSGDDVLVGNASDFDTNLTALLALLAEWARTDATYSVRAQHLRGLTGGGLNGSVYLNSSTIDDDAVIDQLYGEAGSDLFFATAAVAAKDKVNDLASGETTVNL